MNNDVVDMKMTSNLDKSSHREPLKRGNLRI